MTERAAKIAFLIVFPVLVAVCMYIAVAGGAGS